jgi:hypothetical protein
MTVDDDKKALRDELSVLINNGDVAGLQSMHECGLWTDLELAGPKIIQHPFFDPTNMVVQRGWQWSPLAQAAGKKQLDVMVCLLEMGANVDDSRENHVNPAAEAAMNGFPAGVKLLEKHGCMVASNLGCLEWEGVSIEYLRNILFRANARLDGVFTPDRA